ncbi:hypothetical protein F751_4181 [Auxenochlorella protothecoides]|uniref:Uncharacterized protein n=1 Tax=Auxenochlorella protothecoides TaxID=3075 RepID=A0A087SJM5_AUXPR|nr:hypothetical protein F751_4181 [Auxenochlorella protothecoides]KFM25929.1 hypothetical protein F751_4181 [Auxenochlorella protothecoides]
MGALHLVRSHIEPGVLGAAASVSVKLIMICSVVAWLLRTERIPADTATTLSKLAYHLLIPCLMFVRVSGTLSTIESPMLLVSIAGVATLQAALGAACGLLLGPLVDGAYPRAWAVGGWHPLRPSRPALEIAASLADAAGLDRARADALAAQPAPAPQGSRQLLVLACAFGNSFTLPAILLSTLFSGARADACVGYAALCLLVLDGLVWSVGLGAVRAATPGVPRRSLPEALRASLNPPMLGMLAGVAAGLTPLGRRHLLALARGLLRCALEAAAALAAGAFALMTLGPGPVVGLVRRAAALLRPEDALEARTLAAVGLTRFLVLPLATTLALRAVPLPGVGPLPLLVLLLQSTMPPAQNLVILLQLSRGTRQDAPRFARTLLKLYALGTLPVTLWVTTFVAQAGLALG